MNPSAPKFSVSELSGGCIEDYHNGLSGRVGKHDVILKKIENNFYSKLLLLNFQTGVPDLAFGKAVRAEHSMLPGCDHEFETSNYHIKTTAKREWAIVVDKEPLTSDEAAHGRRVPDLKDLERLSITKKAKLFPTEIIALVLYTGPMVSSLFENLKYRDIYFCFSLWFTTQFFDDFRKLCSTHIKNAAIFFPRRFMFFSRPWSRLRGKRRSRKALYCTVGCP